MVDFTKLEDERSIPYKKEKQNGNRSMKLKEINKRTRENILSMRQVDTVTCEPSQDYSSSL